MQLIFWPVLFLGLWFLAKQLRRVLPGWMSDTLGVVVFIVVSGFGVVVAGYFTWLCFQYPNWAPLLLLIVAFGVGCVFAGNALRAALHGS